MCAFVIVYDNFSTRTYAYLNEKHEKVKNGNENKKKKKKKTFYLIINPACKQIQS